MRFFFCKGQLDKLCSITTPDRLEVVRLKNLITMKCYFTIRF